jgi:hypothetical protein
MRPFFSFFAITVLALPADLLLDREDVKKALAYIESVTSGS